MASDRLSTNARLMAAMSRRSDDEWLELNLAAYRRARGLTGSGDAPPPGLMGRVFRWAKQHDSLDLPGFPDDELQERIVGAYGEDALREGFAFYREVTRAAEAFHIPL